MAAGASWVDRAGCHGGGTRPRVLRAPRPLMPGSSWGHVCCTLAGSPALCAGLGDEQHAGWVAVPVLALRSTQCRMSVQPAGAAWGQWHHAGFKCPICSKSVASDEMEMHFIMCLSKPRLSYNDDVLTKDAGECVICLEELLQGDTIARLPCLCIYHKSCIDSWFEVNRSCPEHPSD
ncbi:E3 ubiquitin-protein ligase ZNRF1 isoform X2 [Meleagris gallopavo]|uniref:E3 ubiquitin-protein ligase ZNRF1 isoform X2 n=1 Tax=Meleagris gallopavo TaxID=9103 RepID=UPI00093DE6FB|nr:E3 ubiquitin-protein ligase ZNRF1 isoform X2 [Meleagris gallopavo]